MRLSVRKSLNVPEVLFGTDGTVGTDRTHGEKDLLMAAIDGAAVGDAAPAELCAPSELTGTAARTANPDTLLVKTLLQDAPRSAPQPASHDSPADQEKIRLLRDKPTVPDTKQIPDAFYKNAAISLASALCEQVLIHSTLN